MSKKTTRLKSNELPSKPAGPEFKIDTSLSHEQTHFKPLCWLNKQYIGIEQVATLADWDKYPEATIKPLQDAAHNLMRGRSIELSFRADKTGEWNLEGVEFRGKRYRLVEDLS